MKDVQVEPPAATRADYERPVLKRIDLMAEEVLATGCKTGVTTSPGSFTPPCNAAGCSAVGS